MTADHSTECHICQLDETDGRELRALPKPGQPPAPICAWCLPLVASTATFTDLPPWLDGGKG